MSEALTLASTNPKYDKILFIDLPVQCIKTTSSEHVVYLNCSGLKLFWMSKQKQKTTYVHNMFSNVLSIFWACSELAIFMHWTGDSINNLLSCCGLVDVRTNANEKDLPVPENVIGKNV